MSYALFLYDNLKVDQKEKKSIPCYFFYFWKWCFSIEFTFVTSYKNRLSKFELPKKLEFSSNKNFVYNFLNIPKNESIQNLRKKKLTSSVNTNIACVSCGISNLNIMIGIQQSITCSIGIYLITLHGSGIFAGIHITAFVTF